MSLLAILASTTVTAPARREPSPSSGPVRNIASRCEAASLGMTPANRDGQTATTKHVASVDATSVTLTWEVARSYGPDAGGTFSGIISVADQSLPITIGGKSSWRVEVPTASTTYVSDPLDLKILAGDDITISITVDADGATGGVSSSYSGPEAAAWNGWAWRPARITAPSNIPAWVCVGDSIAQQARSFPGIGCDLAGRPYTVTAMGGDAYVYYPERFAGKVGPHLAAHSRMLDQFGINSASTTENEKKYALRYWKTARDNGITDHVKTTITPAASSSDKYATVENQTPARQPYIAEFNTWLRDGAPLSADLTVPLAAGTTDPGAVRARYVRPDGTIVPASGPAKHLLSGITDCAHVIESSPGSGKFIPGYPIEAYNDGTHLGRQFHQMLGERIARDLDLMGY